MRLDEVQSKEKCNQMGETAGMEVMPVHEPIKMQSMDECFAMDLKPRELESKMLAYRLYRGHDLSTVCIN